MNREHLNVFVDAFLVYLDDHQYREGTRLEVKWVKTARPPWGRMSDPPISSMEFADEIGALLAWRRSVFGAEPQAAGQPDGVLMDHPAMLASVERHAETAAMKEWTRRTRRR